MIGFLLGFLFGVLFLGIMALALAYFTGIDIVGVYYNKIKDKPDEIHVESIFIDKVYEKLLGFVKENGTRCMVTTPQDYEFLKNLHRIELSEDEFREILVERYRTLAQYCTIGLHIHLAPEESINKLNEKKQEKIINQGLKFLEEEVGVNPEYFAPGYWSYNDTTIEVCKKLGLKRFTVSRAKLRQNGYPEVSGIEIIKINNSKHDPYL